MKRLTANEFNRLMSSRTENLSSVDTIIQSVREDGDAGARWFTCLFDKVDVEQFEVSNDEVERALKSVDPVVMNAIREMVENIRRFAVIQKNQLKDFETELNPGIFTGQRVIPIDSVCAYVPGGRYPLISSAIMGVIPASVAGVREICLASPPSFKGTIPPEILAAGSLSGAHRFFRIGGAQAIAAFAYGTESIPGVDKIVGPGNRFVAEAKRKVYGAVGIDFIAGPTELAIVVDSTADPVLTASDLLAQAEHDRDASVFLFADCENTVQAVLKEIQTQLDQSPDCTAQYSLNSNGGLMIYESPFEAAQWVNKLAPEHLSLQGITVEENSRLFRNFGSMFLGGASCEALADYSAGINHTLPTGRAARYSAGLNVMDFLKCQTTLRVTESFDQKIFNVSERMAQAEGLIFHSESLQKRTLMNRVL